MTPYFEDSSSTIYHGDSATVLAEMEPESIDLTVTSPPYDDLRQYNGYQFDFEKIAQELFRVTKSGGVVVWVVGDATVDGSETGTSFEQALYFKKQCGFRLHDTMIYEKTAGATGSNYCYWQSFEYMFVLSKDRPKTINLIADRRNVTKPGLSFKANGHRTPSGDKKPKRLIEYRETGIRNNIWRYHTGTSVDDRTEHPAQFPELLVNDHIRSWSKPGDTVLDCFMGSNTTGKMAKKNGCKFIGIDISEQYCAMSVNRTRQEVLAF